MSDYMKEAERLTAAHESAIRQHDRGAEWDEGPAKTLAALLAHIQRGAVPEGWQLVPKEPTKDMVEAAYDNVTGGGGRAAIYAAMLAAAQEREARMRKLLQAADVLFAHHCRDCTAQNWLDDTRAALAEGGRG